MEIFLLPTLKTPAQTVLLRLHKKPAPFQDLARKGAGYILLQGFWIQAVSIHLLCCNIPIKHNWPQQVPRASPHCFPARCGAKSPD